MILSASHTKSIFKYFLLATLFVFAILNARQVSADKSFFSVISDLPVMPGLSEVTGSAVKFSTPQGRILEISASGKSGAKLRENDVRSFYLQTLPQLGWEPSNDGSWVREDERLRLAISGIRGVLIAQFSLTPK